MGAARTAGFRNLRGTGWSFALPLAGLIGYVLGVAASPAVGIVAGSIVSLFGLFLLAIGYSLGNIFGGYWMVPLALASLPAAAVASLFTAGHDWAWAFLWVGLVVLTFGIIAGIQRTANTNGGLPELIGNIAGSLVPGRYT